MSNEVKAALLGAAVAALATMGAAFLGGFATYRGVEKQIEATANSAAEERHSTAVGTARLMRQEFDAWAQLMQDRIGAGRYARAQIVIGTELEPETRLQVARAVDYQVWEKVARAVSVAPKAQRLANRMPDKRALIEGDRKQAPLYRDAFRAASEALRPLATEATS